MERSRASERGRWVTKMATPVPARVAAKEKAQPDPAEGKEGDASEAKDADADLAQLHWPPRSKRSSSTSSPPRGSQGAADRRQVARARRQGQNRTGRAALHAPRADRAAEEAKPKSWTRRRPSSRSWWPSTRRRRPSCATRRRRRRDAAHDLGAPEDGERAEYEAGRGEAAASRDMLRQNVQQHAEEFKRLLHREVTGMFEDVGRIREAKRIWSLRSRILGDQEPASARRGWGTADTAPRVDQRADRADEHARADAGGQTCASARADHRCAERGAGTGPPKPAAQHQPHRQSASERASDCTASRPEISPSSTTRHSHQEPTPEEGRRQPLRHQLWPARTRQQVDTSRCA